MGGGTLSPSELGVRMWGVVERRDVEPSLGTSVSLGRGRQGHSSGHGRVTAMVGTH